MATKLSSMNISLSEKLKKDVLKVVDQGSFSNPSDYMRSLARADIERRAITIARIKKELQEVIDADEWIEVTPESNAALRKRAHARLKKLQDAQNN